MAENINIIIGIKIKNRRTMLGMSQNHLAKQMGVSFQQIQKYESGANSLNILRLDSLYKALNVPVSFFFEDDALDIKFDNDDTSISERELLEIVKSLQEIKDPTIRKRVADLVRSIAKLEQ